MSSEMRQGGEYAAGAPEGELQLRLYVTDWTPRCVAAYRKLKKICQELAPGRCNIEVIDLLEHPEAARKEQIVAVPTLKKLAPKPERVLIGDFTQTEQVLSALALEPGGSPPEDIARIGFEMGAGGPKAAFLGVSDRSPVSKLSGFGGVDGQ